MKKATSAILCLAILISCTVFSQAYTCDEMTSKLQAWLINNITVEEAEGKIDSYLDWTVFSMARSGNTSYNAKYAAYIGTAVAGAEQLWLSDCARIALAASAVGLDASNIGGVNLIDKIEKTNLEDEAYTAGIAYALIALANAAPSSAAVRPLINCLLAAQRADGGFNSSLKADENSSWTLNGETDSTGMVLQALAPFKDEAAVAAAVEKSLAFIKKEMLDDAGYGSWGSASAESTSQILAALCELGIDPLSKEYKKTDKTILTALSAYINPDGGARCYDGTSNIMTSYQLLFALDAYEWENSKYSTSLFDASCTDSSCTCLSHSRFGKFLPQLAEVLCKIERWFSGLFNFEYVCCKHI